MDNGSVYRCRLCLNQTSKKVDIFRHDFPKMIELLAGIKVDPEDNFPKESCLDCAKNVKFCMSVRKQILLSHKELLKEFVHEKIVGSTLEEAMSNTKLLVSEKELVEPVKSQVKRPLRRRRSRRRPQTPESTSDEDDEENFENFSKNENFEEVKEEIDATDRDLEDEEFVEEITLISEVRPEAEAQSGGIKAEVSQNIKLEVDPAESSQEIPPSQQPLSPERLRRKRNMIAMSNKILQQEKMSDKRYSNVIFVRKSVREKMKKQTQGAKPRLKQEKSDDSNIIWKNGKKYAACEICKKEVKKHYLKHHMSTHFPEHFSCDICGVTTRNLRGLRYHKLYWHSSKLDYICDKCGKKYRSKHALDLHNKKEHGGVRDLECNICGKKFFQKMHLKRHIDGIHKKLRPHKCEYCGKDFSKRTHLVTHWRTHTNETPYGCEMCGERFKLKLSLKNHLRRAHNFEEKERAFCDICNRGFATEQGLRAHINSRIHEGEKCQYCAESFTPEYLQVHLREVHLNVDYF
ncbi:zinc finger protein 567-like [Euwallacea similis]|uniref:zinc finger protein 567-like n=1 Tax=Euwallacea similis TaxID=1736056 RepID=UPI00344D7CE6